MRYILLLAAALFTGIAAHAQKITPAAPGVTYGVGVTAKDAISTPQLSKALRTDTAYHGRVTGEVIEVCTKKGCFMKLSQAQGSPITIRFKDYAYFMPQNIVGKTVVVEGVAHVTETSAEELRHYAADAGKSAQEIAAIKDAKKDIEFTADGVLVVK